MDTVVKRIPEPELMLNEEQARAYAEADFQEPHQRFVEFLKTRLPQLPKGGRAVDLGCGPGDVTFRFARAFPGWTVDAVDGSPAMLRLAREAVVRESFEERIRFREVRLPDERLGTGYDLVVSNSLLHHLADPRVLWSTIVRAGRPGGAVFVMDLARPDGEEQARALVEQYAGTEPEVLRRDFHNSLLAAWRPDEVRRQLREAGLEGLVVDAVPDRHLIVWGCLPTHARGSLRA